MLVVDEHDIGIIMQNNLKVSKQFAKVLVQLIKC